MLPLRSFSIGNHTCRPRPAPKMKDFCVFDKFCDFHDSEEKTIGQSKFTPGRREARFGIFVIFGIFALAGNAENAENAESGPDRSRVLCENSRMKKCGICENVPHPRPRQILCFPYGINIVVAPGNSNMVNQRARRDMRGRFFHGPAKSTKYHRIANQWISHRKQ